MASAFKCDNCRKYFNENIGIIQSIYENNKELSTWKKFDLSFSITSFSMGDNKDQDICPECVILFLESAIIYLKKEV